LGSPYKRRRLEAAAFIWPSGQIGGAQMGIAPQHLQLTMSQNRGDFDGVKLLLEER
jgi:hypothetical protein